MIDIDLDLKDIKGVIETYKINNSSVFLYITSEKNEKNISNQIFNNILYKNLNFDEDKIYFEENFVIDENLLYMIIGENLIVSQSY